MEDLAEKDATEKSDAAREAFLAELALDSKKGVKGGNDNLRHTQEKTKDKKKNKEYRKAKDTKVFNCVCLVIFFLVGVVNMYVTIHEDILIFNIFFSLLLQGNGVSDEHMHHDETAERYVSLFLMCILFN